MQDECCAKCRFFNSEGKIHHCRRFPPQAIYSSVRQGNVESRDWTSSVFPPVKLHIWCGEFQPIPQPKGPSNE